MENKPVRVIKKLEQEIEFSIITGKELAAADYLLTIVDGTCTLSLVNDDDEEGEGTTVVSFEDGSYRIQNTGHGWTGEWITISKQDLKALIVKLAPHNDGSHWSLVGRLRKC